VLRHIYDGLGKLANELHPIANEADLIKMGQGKKEISDTMASRIEENLSLTREWMSRDNERFITLDEQNYRLISKIMALPEEKRHELDLILP